MSTSTMGSERAGEIPQEALIALIGRNVIRLLGTPPNLLKVKVCPVGNGFYRVNIMVGADINSARIVKSYFLTSDEKGNILSSDPTIARSY